EVQAVSASSALASAEAGHWAGVTFTGETLKRLIEDYDLYPEDRAKRPLEDVIHRMQHDIRIEPLPGGTLEVSFTHRDPYRAQQVGSKLMQHFMQSNLVDRSRSDDRKLAYTLRITPADMPNLPEVASSRSRVKMMGAGLGGGLLLGLGVSLVRRRFSRPRS